MIGLWTHVLVLGKYLKNIYRIESDKMNYTSDYDNTYMNLNEYVCEDISVYDEDYPVKFFSNSIKGRLSQAENIVKSIYNEVIKDASIFSQVEKASKRSVKYVVDMAESMLEDIESGKIKLTQEKGGQVFAQIRQPNGHYGEKLPIKREEICNGLDAAQMANTLQLNVLKNQLEEITYQIYAIEGNVKDVLKGQQSDRIALFHSGKALFLESEKTTDITLKSLLRAQALRALSDSTYQLELKMKDDITYLVNKEYDNGKARNRVDAIQAKMNDIDMSFAIVHQTTMMKAAIYCHIGEINAMASVLDEYARLIEGTIATNASLLAQCDVRDNGLVDGIWKKRASLRLDTGELVKQIESSEKVIYLSIVKEEE